MKHAAAILFIAYSCVGFSMLIGNTEGAGLFTAIIAVGLYAVKAKGGA